MTRKLIGLIAFVATGIGLMISTIMKNMNLLNTGITAIVGCFFVISLAEHFDELRD